MAIAKIEKKPAAFSTAAIVQFAVAGLLVAVALLFGWFAFGNWRFKTSLLEGYRAYDVGNTGQAAPALRDALSWRPEHPGARELLAKIAAESGALDQAESHYKKLRELGHNPPRVRVGMGVVHLRAAEKLDDPKLLQEAVGRAREEFRAAGPEAPEGEIGLGHCDLLLAWKLKDEKALAAARATFEKLRKTIDGRVTRAGLLDYYAGLGKALSTAAGYDPAASAAWKACLQLSGRWVAPQSALLLSEARRFEALKTAVDPALLLETRRLRNEASAQFRNLGAEAARPLQEAWMAYTLAVAEACARGGNLNEFTLLMGDFRNPGSGFSDRPEPLLVEARVRTQAATADLPNIGLQDGAMRTAINAYIELDKKLGGDDATAKARKALALNNLGWLEAWRGSYTNNKTLLGSAAKRFEEAVRLAPDEYLYARNGLVVHKRLASAPAASAALLEAAKKSGVAEWKIDFEELQKHLEGK